MKNLFLIFFLLVGLNALAQSKTEIEKNSVMEKVNQFFVALEKKDTMLYNKLVLKGGQIWTVRKLKDSTKTSMRSFSDDITKLAGMNTVIQERPLSFEINIHQDIAIAWVPYTLSLSGKFSHCGVDVFTLLKTDDGWKIVNLSYSVEPDGCGTLQKQ